MAKVILGMTMSLDGFINDRRGSVGALYPDLDTLRNTEPLRESIQNTGAVVMGWNTYAMAEDPDSYAGNVERILNSASSSHKRVNDMKKQVLLIQGGGAGAGVKVLWIHRHKPEQS